MKYFLETYSTTIIFYLFIILVELYVLFIIQTQDQGIQTPSFSNKMVEPPSDDRTTPPSEDGTTPPPKNVTTPPPLLEDVTLPPKDTTTTLLSDDSQETTENNTGKIILLLLQIFVIVYLIALYFKCFPEEPSLNEDINDYNNYSNFYKYHLFFISIVGTVTMITSFVLYSTSPLDITNFVLAWIYFFLDVGFLVYFHTKEREYQGILNRGNQEIQVDSNQRSSSSQQGSSSSSQQGSSSLSLQGSSSLSLQGSSSSIQPTTTTRKFRNRYCMAEVIKHQ